MVEFNRDIFFSEYKTARERNMEMHNRFDEKGYLTLYDVYDICRIGPKKPEYKNWGWDDRFALPELLYNQTDDTSKIHIRVDPVFKENWGPEPVTEVVEEKTTEETILKGYGMTHKEFEELLNELDGNSVATLASKNARYAPGNDALHNFNKGADIGGGTPAQACWGYMTKHLVALRDKVERNDFHDREDLMEKCQDVINYVRILWCIGNAEMKKYVTNGIEKETE